MELWLQRWLLDLTTSARAAISPSHPPLPIGCRAAHKRDPEVNMDLFTLRPAKEESALECQPKQQTQSQVAGGAKEQSMYCKELIHSGVIELSFEELRAQRYYKCISRGLDGRH